MSSRQEIFRPLDSHHRAIAMQTIADIEHRLDELPLLPTVVTRLLSLDADGEDYFDQVLGLSEEDPTFALRIIKLSNSAYSSPESDISNLREAFMRLGVKAVAGVITSMAAVRTFIPTTKAQKNLWVHSIQVAVAARSIARIVTSHEIDPEQAYLCGLLHDIGRFVLFDAAADEMNLVEEGGWESPLQLIAVEQEIYGFDHSELGHSVCRKWGVAPVITKVVAKHHEYGSPKNALNDSKLFELIRVVQIADCFSAFMLVNSDAMSWEPGVLEKELVEKCIDPIGSVPPVSARQLSSIAPKIVEDSSQMASRLGVGIR